MGGSPSQNLSMMSLPRRGISNSKMDCDESETQKQANVRRT